MVKKIVCYIDGSYSNSCPYVVGFAGIILYNNSYFCFSDYFYSQHKLTSIVSELMACVTLLHYIKHNFSNIDTIIVYVDSEYIVNIANKVYTNINAHHDIWDAIFFIKTKMKVQFCWLKAHNGNVYNEFCDKMAKISRTWHIKHVGTFDYVHCACNKILKY